MRKRKYFLVLLISCFLLTGCSVSYDLLIQENGGYAEQFLAGEDNSTLNLRYGNPNLGVTATLTGMQQKYDLTGYEVIKSIGENNSSTVLYREYGSKEDFLAQSLFLKNYAKDISIVDEGDTYQLHMTVFYEFSSKESAWQDSFSIIPISITSSRYVVSNNADRVEKNNMSYTWILDRDHQSKEVSLVIDKNKEVQKPNQFLNFFQGSGLWIGLGVCIVVVFGAFTLFKKIKQNNRI